MIYDSETGFSNAWANEGTVPFRPGGGGGWVLVPEPSDALSLATGFAWGAVLRRRR